MDIVVAHNFYQQPGGEDQCVAAEVAVLRQHGHNVIEYSLHNDTIARMSRAGLAARTLWNRQTYGEFRALLRTHRPQIAHFHNTFPLISPAAYYAAQAENVRVVQTVHNYRLLCANALLSRNGAICEDCVGRALPWPSVLHACYRGSRIATTGVAAMQGLHWALGTWHNAVNTYVALTEGGRHRLIQGGLPTDRIVVKPNFAHPDPGPGSGRGGYALFVGRLSAEKGIDTLIVAWKFLAGEIPLHIVGDGPERSLVQAARDQLPNCVWHGAVGREKVYSLMGEAEFLVLPSRVYETFALVISEAFAKGTPVICSGIGAMAELVEHARTGLHFKPGNAAELAKAVRRLLADPERLQGMRHAARLEFEEKFTAAANYDALMAIYSRALDGSPACRMSHTSPPKA